MARNRLHSLAVHHRPLPDRFQQSLTLAAGAALGYLAMLDWIGLWFHAPWIRYPWMLGGALVVWGAWWGISRDVQISLATQRGLWWALLGVLGGYGLQVGYLWNRQGVLAQGWLGWPPSTAWSSSLLGIAVIVLAILAIARTGAWHLDAGLRLPADADAPAERVEFLRHQRALLVWILGLCAAMTLLQSSDPRTIDFAEGLALSWAQQHFAIFGFLAGYGIESRRQRRLRDWRRPQPASRLTSSRPPSPSGHAALV